jgi:hypothetical protein
MTENDEGAWASDPVREEPRGYERVRGWGTALAILVILVGILGVVAGMCAWLLR